MFNFQGLIIGLIGRTACIKGEYYFTRKLRVLFLIIGLFSVGMAFFVEDVILSSVLSIFGFTFLWGIHEIIEQEERVRKGWFPRRKKLRKDA